MNANTKPLALRQPLTSETWSMITSVAPAIAKGRVWPMPSPEAAMSVMLMGAELGLSFTASFQYIHFIEGKPSLSPQGALAIIRQSGLLESIQVIEDAQGCSVTMMRRGGESYTSRWTVGDARRAGLIKDRGAWEKYPANLCRWRAIGYCADFLFPDVLGGLKRADEFGASIDEAGNVTDAAFTPTTVDIDAASTTPETPTYSAEDLIWQYGADAFVTAGGLLAQTTADLAAVAERLAAESTSTGGGA